MPLVAVLATVGLGLATTSVADTAPLRGISQGQYVRALTCASTDAVLAGMLEGGTPTQGDLEDAALFRARAKDWLTRAVAASAAGQDAALADFDRETRSLGQSVFAAKDAQSAQVLLDTRLLGCDESGTGQSASAPAEGAGDAPAISIMGASPA